MDGSLFSLATGWTLSAESYIDLGGKSERADDTRLTTIKLLSAEESSYYTITRNSDQVVLYSGTIGETGEFETQRDWTTNTAVTVDVRLQGFKSFTTSATMGNAGLSIAVNSVKDIKYKAKTGRMDETHFRWRNDNGTETSATWKQNEDTDHTGQAKSANVRIRFQIDEYKVKSNPIKPKLQYRRVTSSPTGEWVDIE